MSQVLTQLFTAGVHIQAGQLAQAKAVLAQALAIEPDNVDANTSMCRVLTGLREHALLLDYAQRAAALIPGSPAILNNLANARQLNLDFRGAAADYRRALDLDPAFRPAILGLASALNQAGSYPEAEAACRRGLALTPGAPDLLHLLAMTLIPVGRAREAIPLLREALAKQPTSEPIHSLLAFALNYTAATPDEIAAAHRDYGRLLQRLYPQPPEPLKNTPDPDRRLRIGLLSADLRSHPVGRFIEPLLELHDRSRFEFSCYSTAPTEDAFTARLRALAAQWRAVAPDSIRQLAHKIRTDAIDILIDLSGHTTGHRLPVLRLRPAPVQATYLGYPNTTGIAECDARIVDSLTDPPAFDGRGTERLWRLDPCFLCYRPPEDAPEAGPADRGGPITFGSFNALAKLDDETVALHAAALGAVPGSRLLMKYMTLREPAVLESVRARFAAAGVAPDRLILEPPAPGAAEFLRAYHRVHIALDTFPYHGTTTTCEALYMGVPVVTLAGHTSAARVGVSLLAAAGLPELVAQTPEEFARIAAGLAADRPHLTEIRAGLRARLLASPLCDAAAFAAGFQGTLRAMWAAHCAKA